MSCIRRFFARNWLRVGEVRREANDAIWSANCDKMRLAAVWESEVRTRVGK